MRLPPVRQAAEHTPADRDRLLDALRGFSLIAVVLGHVAMAMVGWTDQGDPVVGNLLASSQGLQVLTWFLQVIPLFFLAGGAANSMSWRRARMRQVSYPTWVWGRVERLYRPVLVYLAFLAIAGTLATATVGQASEAILALACQMLWFLGIYVIATMLLPAMLWIHDRGHLTVFVIGIPVVVGLNLGVTFWGWPLPVSFANFLLVWLLVQQLGFFWSQPSSQLAWSAVLLFCLPTSIALVALGPWPLSLVGIPGEAVSNMAPPSVVLLLHAGTMCSIVYLARTPLTRWLHRPTPWLVAVTMSMTAMTVYLWHVPAMVGAVMTLQGVGLGPPTTVQDGIPRPVTLASYGAWWLLFLLVFMVLLIILVLLIWPMEHARLPVWDSRRRVALPMAAPAWVAPPLTVLSCVLVGCATLVLAIIGFAGFPLKWIPWYGLELNSLAACLAILLGCLGVRAAAGRQA